MQLFITNFEKNGDTLRIVEDRVCKQMRTVLRMSAGDTCYLQLPVTRGEVVRYKVEIEYIKKDHVQTSLIDQEVYNSLSRDTAVCIAIPNKLAKLELICQKLTEIGVQAMYIWKAKRSQLSDVSGNKRKRLEAIVLEAAEQSFAYYVPRLELLQDAKVVATTYQPLLADMGGYSHTDIAVGSGSKPYALVVGPEGGLTDDDYAFWSSPRQSAVSLGASVLRMETAAIVGAWWLVNH